MLSHIKVTCTNVALAFDGMSDVPQITHCLKNIWFVVYWIVTHMLINALRMTF